MNHTHSWKHLGRAVLFALGVAFVLVPLVGCGDDDDPERTYDTFADDTDASK